MIDNAFLLGCIIALYISLVLLACDVASLHKKLDDVKELLEVIKRELKCRRGSS